MIGMGTLAAFCATGLIARMAFSAAQQGQRSQQGQRGQRSLRHRRGQPLARRSPPPRDGREIEVRRFRLTLEHKVEAAVAVLALKLAVASLFFPLLGLPSAALLAYLAAPALLRAARATRRGRFQIDQVFTAIAVAGLASANFVGSAILGIAGRFRDHVLAATESHFVDSLSSSFATLPKKVWLSVEGREIEVPVAQVKPGDLVVVRSMETIPIDGVIETGIGRIDQHQFTGEWQPVELGPGNQVFAGTILQFGTLQIRAEKAGDDTRAGEIQKMLLQSSHHHLSIQSKGEAIANGMTPFALAVGFGALPFFGLYRAAALSGAVTSGPVRLIAPILMLQTLAAAGRDGVLIKDGRVLETLKDVDTVLFDKTGTLTTPEPTVGDVHPLDGRDGADILALAARAEYRQPHPIARAIAQAAARAAAQATDQTARAPFPDEDTVIETLPGLGVATRVDGALVRVGSSRFFGQVGLSIPAPLLPAVAAGEAQGHSLVFVAIDDTVIGAIELVPDIRPEARAVVATLKEQGITPIIVSGDRLVSTRSLAEKIGIEHYFAEVLPEEKAELVSRLQKDGHNLCFVGDGVNDTLALKGANVSISLHGAADLAIDTAQIILTTPNLKLILYCMALVKQFDQHLHRGWSVSTIPPYTVIPAVILLHAGIGTLALGLMSGLALGLAVSTQGLKRSLAEVRSALPDSAERMIEVPASDTVPEELGRKNHEI